MSEFDLDCELELERELEAEETQPMPPEDIGPVEVAPASQTQATQPTIPMLIPTNPVESMLRMLRGWKKVEVQNQQNPDFMPPIGCMASDGRTMFTPKRKTQTSECDYDMDYDIFKIYAFRGRVDLNGKNVSLVDAGAERSLMRVVDTGELIRVRSGNFKGPLTPDFVEVDALLDAVLDRVCVNEAVRIKRQKRDDGREAERQKREAKREVERVRQAEKEEEERRMQDPEYQAGLEREGAAAEEEAYQEWLDVMCRFRTDPTLFDDVLNRDDPFGAGFDANQNYAIVGIHPFYDYGFETQRGRGRVLWDLFRPRLKQEVKNIKASNILWFWREAAARTAMHPSRINFEQERRTALGMTKRPTSR